ncbi:MAG: PadR family transcriptional regulator [Anaerolineaceae bacterium]
MEYVVLGLLIIQAMTLYEMNQAFKNGISMIYSASYGSLQIAVRKLLEKEMIVFEEVVDKGRNKKIYTITPRGKQAFLEWMLEEIPPSKVELVGLSKVYFLGLIPDIGQRQQIVADILAKIRMVEGELLNLNDSLGEMDIPESWREIAHFSRKTLEYGLGAHAFAREWAESILKELQGSPGIATGEQR